MYLCCRRLKDQRGVVRHQVGAGDRVGGPGSRGLGGRAHGTCSSLLPEEGPGVDPQGEPTLVKDLIAGE